jgi:MYXO-CTERM domain-containing protein
VTLSGITATAVDNVGFKAQSAAGGPYLVDNLLVGTTWADVTPAGVPEPATFAFAALGLLGGFLLRFRRR